MSNAGTMKHSPGVRIRLEDHDHTCPGNSDNNTIHTRYIERRCKKNQIRSTNIANRTGAGACWGGPLRLTPAGTKSQESRYKAQNRYELTQIVKIESRFTYTSPIRVGNILGTRGCTLPHGLTRTTR